MSDQQEKRKRKGPDRNRHDHPASKVASLLGKNGENAGASGEPRGQNHNHIHNHDHTHNNPNSRRKRGRNNNNNNSKLTKNHHHHHHPGHPVSSNNKGNVAVDDDDKLNNDPNMLRWKSTEPHVPLAAEEDMLQVILRWGEKERGMLRDQPPFRQAEIQKRCKRNRIHVSQACSLRRHHMSLLNPYKSKEELRLGSTQDIRASAALFEQAIAAFLRRRHIAYLSEQEQKAEFQRTHPGELVKGTPDFKLKDPVVLSVVYTIDTTPAQKNGRHVSNGTKQQQQQQPQRNEKRTIHWIEAKMFYGASTIPHDNRSAVGCILSKMKTYVKLYGEGAIVFSQGCGAQLAAELGAMGVTALSCFGNHDIDLSDLHRHQRTWCGNQNGTILP